MFTQKQLEEAWEQMKAERQAEYDKAQLAAEWLSQKTGNHCFAALESDKMYYGKLYISPFKNKYLLGIEYGENHKPDVYGIDQVKNIKFKRKFENRIWITTDEIDRFYIDLSQESGFDDVYECYFEYMSIGD